jgi:hypothetical protein
MKAFKVFISYIKRLVGRTRAKPAKNPPETLSPEAMEAVMREVRFLKDGHAVDVRALAPDEMPTIPKRADK